MCIYRKCYIQFQQPMIVYRFFRFHKTKNKIGFFWGFRLYYDFFKKNIVATKPCGALLLPFQYFEPATCPPLYPLPYILNPSLPHTSLPPCYLPPSHLPRCLLLIFLSCLLLRASPFIFLKLPPSPSPPHLCPYLVFGRLALTPTSPRLPYPDPAAVVSISSASTKMQISCQYNKKGNYSKTKCKKGAIPRSRSRFQK
jgi:hypothetical protein